MSVWGVQCRGGGNVVDVAVRVVVIGQIVSVARVGVV